MSTQHSARGLRLDGLAYGGDYNPDQWDEATWHADIRLMRDAGVNIVSLPIFSWPQLEVRPGEFEWGWLDRIIELLWQGGIAIDLATATATPPAWLLRAHPEMMPSDDRGLPLAFGSRQVYCPSSPIWRAHVARMARAMAERYGTHPAVVMWHVSNEYGDHTARCWCPESDRHFRRWLAERYGSIEALNQAWGVGVWGQRYPDFEHIETPKRAPGPINPTQLLDFERFSSDALLELFRAEVDVLREVTPDIPVTTNFMSMFRELDYWRFAEAEDIVTDDAYPDPADPTSHRGAALNYGLMRSLKDGAPWLLLEQSASAVSWRDVNVPKAPGKMRSDSLQAIAHGSDGAMFFQWRQAQYGQEKFHSAMLGHRGERSRTFRETRALGRELRALAEIRGSRVRARVAVVVDWDSWWGETAIESLPSQRLSWASQVRAWAAASFVLGQPVDAVRATGPFDRYDVVLVPNLYVATDEQARALEAFVAAGGTVAVGPFSGVVDPNEAVHPGGAPGPLRDLLGIEVDEVWPIADGLTEQVQFDAVPLGVAHWSEWIEAGEATQVRAQYGTGELAGRPAITRNSHGSGSAWYVSAMLDDDGLSAVMRAVLSDAELPVRERTAGDLDVVTRSDQDTDWTFAINHGTTPLRVNVPAAAVDLLGGEIREGAITLERYGVAVLRTPRTGPVPFLTLAD